MTAEEIRFAMQDDNLSALSLCGKHKWQSIKAEVMKELHKYWLIREDITVPNGDHNEGQKSHSTGIPATKSHRPTAFQPHGQREDQDIVCESLYWINIYNDRENAIKNYPVCLDFQATQCKEETLPHEVPCKPW